MQKQITLLLLCAMTLVAGCFHQPKPPPPDQNPVAKFTYMPTSPKPGEEITFDGSASSAPAGATMIAYEWDFGDGGSAGGAIVTHTYSQGGSYVVKLTVADDANRQATAEQTVTVTAVPSAEFISLPTTMMDLTGLAWDGQNFWVLDGAEKRLYKFSGSGGQALAAFDLEADYPTAVAWSPESQQLFVLDGNGGAIYKINPDDGSKLGQFAPPGLVPLGMSWGAGSLWIADFSELKIYKVDPENGQTLATLSVGVPGAALQGVAWGESGLWVYDSNREMIYKLDAVSGQKLVELLPPGPTTVGLAWDGQNLWVADAQDLKIYKLKP